MNNEDAFLSSTAVKKLNISTRLRVFRAFFRLRRAKMASALGIRERSLRAYETGDRRPNQATETRLRRFLDSKSIWGRKIAEPF